MADILLFQILSCFIVSVIYPLHLLSVNTAFSAWQRTVMPERVPVSQTGYVHVFMNTCYSSV